MIGHLPSFPRLRAIPFFLPGWLYVPMLLYGIPLLPRDLNENVLALFLQIPMMLSLIVIYPLWRRWVTARQVGTYLVLPNVLLFMMWFSTAPD